MVPPGKFRSVLLIKSEENRKGDSDRDQQVEPKRQSSGLLSVNYVLIKSAPSSLNVTLNCGAESSLHVPTMLNSSYSAKMFPKHCM